MYVPYFLTLSINMTSHATGLFAVSIRQALFIAPCSHTFHYKCIKPLLEAHHPAFSCPLCRTYADLEEDVEVEPTDLDEDADADVEIDDVPANNKESDAANQSDNAGAATAAPTPSRATESAQHREDAEMSDGSFNAAPPPLSRPALNPLPPIHLTSGRLLPITERERFHLSTERDREAGGETEVEPDSVGQLSLSSRRVRGAGTGGGGASNARERARYLSTLLSGGGGGGGGACTDDEGTGNGNGVDEVDEVEMGDAIE